MGLPSQLGQADLAGVGDRFGLLISRPDPRPPVHFGEAGRLSAGLGKPGGELKDRRLNRTLHEIGSNAGGEIAHRGLDPGGIVVHPGDTAIEVGGGLEAAEKLTQPFESLIGLARQSLFRQTKIANRLGPVRAPSLQDAEGSLALLPSLGEALFQLSPAGREGLAVALQGFEITDHRIAPDEQSIETFRLTSRALSKAP